MRFIILTIVLFTSLSSIAQDDFKPSEYSLLGKWKISYVHNRNQEIILNRIRDVENYYAVGLHIHIGEYTGRYKLNYFKKEFRRIGLRRCGVRDRPNLPAHGTTSWSYNKGKGILKVKNSKFLNGEEFLVERIDPYRIKLIKI